MNILQLNYYHYLRGGSERYYFEVSRLLEEHGHKVSFFSLRHPDNLPTEFSSYFGEPMSFGSGQSFLNSARTAFRMVYSTGNNRKVKRLAEDFSIDIAHCHNIYQRVCPSVLNVLRRKGIPAVMTLHDYKLMCPTQRLYRAGNICTECSTGGKFHLLKNRCTKGSLGMSLIHFIESKTHELLDIYKKNIAYFICPSRFLMTKFIEAGFPEEKLIHQPYFINTSFYKPLFVRDGYALFAGRLSKEKGLHTLLKAVKGIDITVRVAGDGPMRAEYEAYVRKNKMDNVVFEGYKSGDELKGLFENASFTVCPSEWYDNLPLTILESLAYGKPVVGSNIGGIPEMVREGETGFTFEPGNVEDLREKLVVLNGRRDKVVKMGKNARHLVERDYNPEGHYERLIDIYRMAINGSI